MSDHEICNVLPTLGEHESGSGALEEVQVTGQGGFAGN